MRNQQDYMESVKALLEFRRLKEIKRCNNFRVIKQEDVAQHSYFVAMLVKVIAEDYNKEVKQHNLAFHPYDSDNINDMFSVDAAVSKAIFHDIEEAFTSDIPYYIKHTRNENFNCDLGDVLFSVLHSNTSGIESIEPLVSCRKEAKSGLEGELVAVADLLELAMYCSEEISMGNTTVKSVKDACISEIEKFSITTKLMKFSGVFGFLMEFLRDTKRLSSYIYDELGIKAW